MAVCRTTYLNRNRERRALLTSLKMESGCVDCGYKQHPAALHFDHIDPATKSFELSNAKRRGWEKILAEVAKCEVRCANCHAVRTAGQGHHLIEPQAANALRLF